MRCDPQLINIDGDTAEWKCTACEYVGRDIAKNFPNRIHRPCDAYKKIMPPQPINVGCGSCGKKKRIIC